jgi:hypothetical protein
LHEARGVCGLAARAGTRVEDPFPRFRVERTKDERRRLILDGERSVFESGERRRRAEEITRESG